MADENIVNGKKYKVLQNGIWNILSFFTKASDVEFDDGMNAEEKMQDIESKISSGSNIELDTTLTVEGKAADAKAVGDAINVRCNATGYLEVLVDGVWQQSDLQAISFENVNYIYNKGQKIVELEGLGSHGTNGTTTFDTDCISITTTGYHDSARRQGVTTSVLFNFTDVSELGITYELLSTSLTGDDYAGARFFVGVKNQRHNSDFYVECDAKMSTDYVKTPTKAVITLDTSSISGNYFVYAGIISADTSTSGKITEIFYS